MSLETKPNEEQKRNPDNRHEPTKEELESFAKRFDIPKKPDGEGKSVKALKINNILTHIASHAKHPTIQQSGENTSEPTTLPQPFTKDTVVTNTVDFIPVIGSAKMILESLRGKQYGTDKELSGKLRFIHGLSGALFLAADLTGIGAIASELGKAGIKLSLRSLEKKALQNVVTNETIQQKAERLAVEGEKRRNLQEGVANQ